MVKKEKKINEEILEPSLPEREPIETEEFLTEKEEERELTEQEVKDLMEGVEKTDLDEHLKAQVQGQVKNLKALDDDKKVKKLMELAKSKGVVFAINVAKKMNDPYVLDKLHDLLAKEGYFKKLSK